MTADQVYARWRALSDRVGVYTFMRGERVKLIELDPPLCPTIDLSDDTHIPDQKSQMDRVGCQGDSFLGNGQGGGTEERHDIGLQDLDSGSVTFDRPKKHLMMKCSDGRWLPCLRLQMEGRKASLAIDFANGQHIAKGGHVTFDGFCGQT
jgi:methionyl-tRNA formyltransferase